MSEQAPSKELTLKSGKLLVPLARHLDNGYTEIEGRTYSPYEIRMLREWLNETATHEPGAIAETSVGYRYIPANIATAVCNAAYERASHTNKKAADALRPAMLAIIEAGIQVPGVRAAQPPVPEYESIGWQYKHHSSWGDGSFVWTDSPSHRNGGPPVEAREIFVRATSTKPGEQS